MRNPFQLEKKVVLTAEDFINVLVQKEAELILARVQLQQAKQLIEQLQAKK